ncbi:MAG: hypothetical protein Fur0018_10050 [Anaerolineales bacterium]
MLYLLLNVLVSAVTVNVVLWVWLHYFWPENVPVPAAVPFRPAQSRQTATPFALEAYQVQPGDDLAGVAQRFGVEVTTLRSINGLEGDTLGVGQTIYVPVDVLSAATPTPVPPGDPAAVRIVSVVAAGDARREYVQIAYEGDGEISLLGWQLSTESGQTYPFPVLSLHGGGAVRVHTAPGTDTVVDLYWGRDQALWAAGKQVILIAPDGTVQSTYRIP